MKKIAQTTLVAVLLASLSGTSMASLIFSDDFSDGNRDGWYRYAQNADSSLTVSGGIMEMNNANTATTIANNFTAVRPFDAVDMSVAGTKVTLQLDFVNMTSHANSRGMNIGLYNSNGTVIGADTSAGTDGENDKGWFTRMGRSAFMHNLYGGDFSGSSVGGIRAFGGSAQLLASDNSNTDIRVDGSTTGASIFGVINDPEIWYTYRLEVEALDVGGNVHHAVTASFLQGATLLSTMNFTDTSGTLVGNVDSVGFTSMAGHDFAIDNVSVTVVPEPGTISLLLIGAGVIVGLRRQQMST